jgi:hypothetical protein
VPGNDENTVSVEIRPVHEGGLSGAERVSDLTVCGTTWPANHAVDPVGQGLPERIGQRHVERRVVAVRSALCRKVSGDAIVMAT